MNHGIEVKLLKDVAVVIETLERLGIGVKRTKNMFPSAYIMQYKDTFRVMHFKEMLALDGNEVNITEEDIIRRDSIIQLLVRWGLVECVDEINAETVFIYVLSHTDKVEWKINHKYKRSFKVVE